MASVVVGTAGHIDHGKTTLLRALTGIDADRLPEEQARGMTIDVGYAHLAFDDGVVLDFVDVPGHDRLIGNMLVGAGEIDAALLVVAADDGPRPQTVEHLALLDALGIEDGIAVVTKVDLVSADRRAEVEAITRSLVAGTGLAGAPVLAVSAVSGRGLTELREALHALEHALRERRRPTNEASGGEDGAPRLAVDRVFSVRGHGAVVTGSLRGGLLKAGDTLRREPGGEVVRVRGLQVHGASRDRHDGGRTALNIAGLPSDAIRRGDILTTDRRIHATERLLVELVHRDARSIGPLGAGPRSRASLRLHIGTDQAEATVRRALGGGDAMVLLTLARPAATFAGARGVLREPASGALVAGIRVLDIAPPRGTSRRRMTADRLAQLSAAVAAGSDGAVPAALVALHGALVPVDSEGGQGARAALELAPDVRAALADAAIQLVATHRAEAPLSPGLPLPRARVALLRRLRSLATIERRDVHGAASAVAAVIDDVVREGRLARRGDVLRDPTGGDDPPLELVAAMDRLEAALDVPAPPSLEAAASAAGCPPEGVRALQLDGRIIRIGSDLAWAAATYHRLAGLALELARAAPLTPAALRDATDTSRKYVLAILEDLDRRGVLQRTPEGHIPGPRAPQRDAGVAAIARMRSAIVLAGGRSSRFGGDKLAADLEGTTLLGATIAALADLVDCVVVAGPQLPSDWQRAGLSRVALVPDVEPFGGPLVALENVLAQAAPEADDIAIVVGGDMPRLVPDVLRAMLDRLTNDSAATAVILGREDEGPSTGGPRQVLPLAVRLEAAKVAAREAVEAGQRSMGALLDRLAVIELPAATWRALDPEANTLLDVDTVADLERIERHQVR